MMPPLPRATATDRHGFDVWDEDAVIAYGRAVAEACAARCDKYADAGRAENDGELVDCASYLAAKIREMAKEIDMKEAKRTLATTTWQTR